MEEAIVVVERTIHVAGRGGEGEASGRSSGGSSLPLNPRLRWQGSERRSIIITLEGENGVRRSAGDRLGFRGGIREGWLPA